MHRFGVLLPIFAILCGFTGAGFLLWAAQAQAPLATRWAAQVAADRLKALPDPTSGGSILALQDAGARARGLADAVVTPMVALKMPGLTSGAGAGDGPDRSQTAAAGSAPQVREIRASDKPQLGANNAPQFQLAGQSLSGWLSAGSGGAEPAKPRTTEVASAAPALPAPAAAVATNQTVVAQAAKPANEAQPDAALKDKAGTVADTLSQKFDDLMKSLTGGQVQPADAAKTEPGPTAPVDTVVAPSAEPPVAVAEAASDLVFSGLSFVAGGDQSGTITFSGRGLAGRQLKLFLNDVPIGATTVANNGRWLLDVTHALPLGDHQARADQLGADGKVTHSAIYMFARRAATVAGGETSIVPLAKMATAPAETVKSADASPPAPPVIKILPPDQMGKVASAAPDVATQATAEPVAMAKHASIHARAKLARRLLARKSNRHHHTVLVNLLRGSSVLHVRVPDGLSRASVGYTSQPRRLRPSPARKASSRRCHRAAGKHSIRVLHDVDDDL